MAERDGEPDELGAVRPSESGYAELELELEAVVRGATDALVADGRASVGVEDETANGGPSRVVTVRPTREAACPVTILAQSEAEVSFFVGPPSRSGALTVDLYNRDCDELLNGAREYLAAVLAGRVEVEMREGSEGGRVTFLLPDGERVEHSYNNLWRPRLRLWTVHRFEPY